MHPAGAEQTVGRRQNIPLQPLRELRLVRQKIMHDSRSFLRAVAAEGDIHPALGEEDVARALDFTQQFQTRKGISAELMQCFIL